MPRWWNLADLLAMTLSDEVGHGLPAYAYAEMAELSRSCRNLRFRNNFEDPRPAVAGRE